MLKGGDFVITKNDTIRALYADDFSKFMEEAGLLEIFEKGELRCRHCSKAVTRDNLHALIPTSESWDMYCSEPNCVFKFAEEGRTFTDVFS